MYHEVMIKLLKQTKNMKSKSLSQDKNLQLILTDIGSTWYMKKMSKKLPPLGKQKLSKKAQDKYDRIKRNLQTSNSNWNDWKFQIHWNMLDWVNPRSKIVRKNLFNFFKEIMY